MTDSELTVDELDIILAQHNGEIGVSWEDPNVVTPGTKQALLSWHNKEQAKLLEGIFAEGYDDMHGTYDYNRIVKAAESELTELKGGI